MIIRQVPVEGIITTNAYFYIDEVTKHGFLLDAGAEAEKLLQIVADNHWTIEKILLTHGHFDHIGAVAEISSILKIPYFAHKQSRKYLSDPQYNLSEYFGSPIILNNFQPLDDNAVTSLEVNSDIKLQLIHTPGHTQDSSIFYDTANHLAFVGDTIFKNSRGRTDIPGGNDTQLLQNITNKILTLPDDTILYSGHTEPTTVKAEKRHYVL
ncbi:MAG: MBL fold metallo-hydrolase [Alphaproteobacteria bacterium]|nr:MBL fold metallo-hydrolase [Alphaproteobacteria bacterium]